MNPLSFLAQMIRIAVPYLFAASGGVVAERSGIVSLTLEGFMLSGAFAAVLGTSYSGSPWVGVLCGIVGGLIFAMIHAVATIRYRADQVVVGVAINLLAIGVTRFFLKLFFASSSNSPRVSARRARIRSTSADVGSYCSASSHTRSACAASPACSNARADASSSRAAAAGSSASVLSVR